MPKTIPLTFLLFLSAPLLAMEDSALMSQEEIEKLEESYPFLKNITTITKPDDCYEAVVNVENHFFLKHSAEYNRTSQTYTSEYVKYQNSPPWEEQQLTDSIAPEIKFRYLKTRYQQQKKAKK